MKKKFFCPQPGSNPRPLRFQLTENQIVKNGGVRGDADTPAHHDGYFEFVPILVTATKGAFNAYFGRIVLVLLFAINSFVKAEKKKNRKKNEKKIEKKKWKKKLWFQEKSGYIDQTHSIEISRFFCHLDFTWNQFWRWQKFLRFCNFTGSEFHLCSQFQPLKNAKNAKNQNWEPLNVLKWQLLDLKNHQKLISRKIWAIEKLWNFHTLSGVAISSVAIGFKIGIVKKN